MGGLRSGIWALMFTDLVGSTAQLARLGDEGGIALRREHDSIASRAAARHGGEVVKSTGDGLLLAFPTAAEAINAAVATQQAIERRNRDAREPIVVRIGISAGEATYESGDLFGLAVNEAARVCAICEGGSVVVSEIARVLAGSQITHEMRGPTVHELKGLPAPVAVWEVVLSSEAPIAGLPAALGSDEPLVGRVEELRVLEAAWSEALAGRRAAVFVAGEPGMGKTSLATRLAHIAHGQGARVLFGGCEDDALIAYQPFAEALRWHARHDPVPAFGSAPRELARLVPGIPLPDAVPRDDRAALEEEGEEQRFFDAVVSWIEELSSDHALVLVVDDIHWASRPTLGLLRHLLRAEGVHRFLLVATYRDTEVDRSHPLGRMLPELRKIPGVRRVRIDGLDEGDVEALVVAETAGGLDDAARARLAEALHRETDGNPFFTLEVLRHLVETDALQEVVDRDGPGGQILIPESVKEVLGERLGRLDADVDLLLHVAAVVGRRFDVGTVAAVAEMREDLTLDALDAAMAAGFVTDVGAGSFSFAHALIRSALLDEISTARRQRLHRRVAEALEARPEAEPSEIAHHWCEAGLAGDLRRAIETSIVAAHGHVERVAFDEAIRQLERALDVSAGAAVEPELRVDLLLELAQARMDGGDVQAARETFDHAADDPGATARQVARAALSYRGPTRVTTENERELALLRRAVGLIDEAEDPATAARLHADLALSTRVGDPARRAHGDRAMHLAGLTQDRLARHEAARVEFWLGLAPGCHYVDAAERALSLACEIGRVALVLDDLSMCCIAYSQRGDAQLYDERVAEFGRLAEATRNPIRLAFVLLMDARSLLARGLLDEAVKTVSRAISTSDDSSILLGWYAITSEVGALRGEHAELAARAGSLLESGTIPPELHGYVRALLATRLADAGDLPGARRVLDELADGGFPSLAPLGEWFRATQLAALARAVAACGASDVAPTVLGLLEPFRGDFLHVSLAVDEGPATLALGRLELVAGDAAAAVSSLDDALRRCEAREIHLKTSEARLALADALVARCEPGDLTRALALLDEVDHFAEVAGAADLIRRADQVRARVRA